MTDRQSPLDHTLHRIRQACHEVGRNPNDVQLLAVSKTWPAESIAALADQGQRHFGENYLQEARQKQQALHQRDLVWHFIGPLQSNKTREIAAHFDWVHSLDRAKIARRLNDQRPADLPPLNVCIQVNVDNEASKGGVPLGAVVELAAQIERLPRLTLRGLMAIPRADNEDGNRRAFRRVAMTQSQLRHTMPAVDTLSMGMSADFPAAIAEGATFIRLGTALFGRRPAPAR